MNISMLNQSLAPNVPFDCSTVSFTLPNPTTLGYC